ncbi:MAG: phosphatidylserine decarboxylase [Planctomycetota bacterium]|jgi:phosphatidylserine decarboxylase
MKIPLTKYGWPQVFIAPALMLAAMLVFFLVATSFLSFWAIFTIEAFLAVVLVWVLSFFRDPYRAVPDDSNLLLAPADGRITNIDLVDENDHIAGPAIKIGIFLGILDVHINRSPCDCVVEKIIYKQGRYKNAIKPDSGKVNESNDLWLLRTEAPNDRLIVRQISGSIARRIICSCSLGQKLTGGQKFGMIKFGSRTELYLPVCDDAKLLVKTGDRVKAGLTALVKYQKINAGNEEKNQK